MPVFTIAYLVVIAVMIWFSRQPHTKGLLAIAGGLALVTALLWASEGGLIDSWAFLILHAAIWITAAMITFDVRSRLTAISAILLVVAGVSVLPLAMTGEDYRAYGNIIQMAGDFAGVGAILCLGYPSIKRPIGRFFDLGRNFGRRVFLARVPDQVRTETRT